MPHTNDAPRSAAGRPYKDNKSRVEPTSSDESRFAVILAVVRTGKVGSGKHLFRLEQIKTTLLERDEAFGRVTSYPHTLNVATLNVLVKSARRRLFCRPTPELSRPA